MSGPAAPAGAVASTAPDGREAPTAPDDAGRRAAEDRFERRAAPDDAGRRGAEDRFERRAPPDDAGRRAAEDRFERRAPPEDAGRGAVEERFERHAAPDGLVELRLDVRPPWAFRLARGGTADGVVRRRGSGLQRLMHLEGEPVLAAVAQVAPERVRFAARAPSERAAAAGIARMRFACGVDDDLRPFHLRFRRDPLLGRALRALPYLRVRRRALPWEALAWAVTEQLIEFPRAAAIQRRLIARLGRRCPRTGLVDVPAPAALAAAAPAALQACDLAAMRALALRRTAREVAAGRIDLLADAPEDGWRRLRRIPGIGRWTVEVLALEGQGRFDQVPAGDLHFLEVVGRLTTGNPRAHADEAEVRGLLAPYGAWQGLAGAYLLAGAGRGLLPPAPFRVAG